MATIEGGGGNDYINGTTGDDTITGLDGNDTIIASDGNDLVDGGAGADSVQAGTGADTVYGGDGADSVSGNTGDDLIWGGAGGDSLHGDDGNDTIYGGDDNDTLYGDLGRDLIAGGAGNDLIYAGDDNDTLGGGAGDDTLYGHGGADTFVVTAESGFDSIEDYSAADGDIILIDYPGITSYADLQPLLSDDGNWGTLISFPDGSVTQIKFLNFASQSASDFSFGANPLCLLRGTLIETATGNRRIETLRPGDLIATHDHGFQPLLHLDITRFRFALGGHRMKPIRIRPGTLGPGAPTQELRVSPQHRIAVPQDRPTGLIAACKLLPFPGFTQRPACRSARYYNLLMARHELIRANGAWVETLLLTDYSRRLARLPLRFSGLAMVPARPVLTGRDLRAMAGGPVAAA